MFEGFLAKVSDGLLPGMGEGFSDPGLFDK
jgi:hypothetical protein